MADRSRAGRTAHHTADKNGRAVLDWPTVERIRKLHSSGLCTYAELSRMFGIAESQINEIVHNKSWVA